MLGQRIAFHDVLASNSLPVPAFSTVSGLQSQRHLAPLDCLGVLPITTRCRHLGHESNDNKLFYDDGIYMRAQTIFEKKDIETDHQESRRPPVHPGNSSGQGFKASLQSIARSGLHDLKSITLGQRSRQGWHGHLLQASKQRFRTRSCA